MIRMRSLRTGDTFRYLRGQATYTYRGNGFFTQDFPRDGHGPWRLSADEDPCVVVVSIQAHDCAAVRS